MADHPSPRRRFQFRLRTLMIVVTLLCAALGLYVGWQRTIVRDRSRMMSAITMGGLNGYRAGFVQMWDVSVNGAEPHIPWTRQRLGDRPVYLIGLPVEASIEYRKQVQAMFPEAEIEAITADSSARNPRFQTWPEDHSATKP
jgi:hypothetical protein